MNKFIHKSLLLKLIDFFQRIVQGLYETLKNVSSKICLAINN